MRNLDLIWNEPTQTIQDSANPNCSGCEGKVLHIFCRQSPQFRLWRYKSKANLMAFLRIDVARKVSVVTPKDLRKDIYDTSIANSFSMTDLPWEVTPGSSEKEILWCRCTVVKAQKRSSGLSSGWKGDLVSGSSGKKCSSRNLRTEAWSASSTTLNSMLVCFHRAFLKQML